MTKCLGVAYREMVGLCTEHPAGSGLPTCRHVYFYCNSIHFDTGTTALARCSKLIDVVNTALFTQSKTNIKILLMLSMTTNTSQKWPRSQYPTKAFFLPQLQRMHTLQSTTLTSAHWMERGQSHAGIKAL